jgi:hypothetical protein
MPTSAQKPDYKEIADALKAGDVVPFLGAGASIGSGFPSGSTLAKRLVAEGKFPDRDGRDNLALVASYLVQITKDSLKLNRLLRGVFCVAAIPDELHLCLASIPEVRLLVTTNYDDLLETALAQMQREPWVVVDRGKPGAVWLRLSPAGWEEVETKQLGRKIVDWKRPLVFKMHGSVDRDDKDNDAFLITEEHYVDFLGRPETGQIPQMLATRMRRRNFLFLGYGLKDWNVRVMLRKLMLTRNPAENIKSWAIVRQASESEKALWRAQGVDMFELKLDEFTERLRAEL